MSDRTAGPPKKPGRVIHVDFGSGARSEGPLRAPPGDRPPDRDTVTRTFTAAEVAALFNVSARRLSAWAKAGIITPSGSGTGKRAAYTFADLLAVRTARGLTEAGFPTALIGKAIARLREEIPDLGQPLTDARVGSSGAQLLARRDGVSFDPATGQVLMDFDVRAIRDDVVKVLKPRRSPRADEAYALYLEGLRLDEDETTRERAEEAYRKAVALDPQLATALTNLGNLRLLAGDRDEAEALYRRALAADPSQPEAPYNLAYLLVERADRREAVALFERAIALRPDFAEAHYNLAMALSELGDDEAARPHWKRYLDLDPAGPWSPIARHHLHR